MSATTASSKSKAPRSEPAQQDRSDTAGDDALNSNEIDSDQEDVGASEEDRVLYAYRDLQSRRVDLVGDYAGDERFLIEGDSMLLRCFDDDRLDFEVGCQMLHAAYNVEHFLHNLVQRKCNFHIVFFESNRELCIPLVAEEANASKYLATRAAIIRHLQVNLAKSHPDIAIDVFTAWDSPDFLNHLQTLSPYFVMAHDGARSANHKAPSLAKYHETTKSKRVSMRSMILSFVAHGFNVALINGLEWRDTKIMTIVLEASRGTVHQTGPVRLAPPTTSVQIVNLWDQFERRQTPEAGLSTRERLAVFTISALLQTDLEKNVSQQEWFELCSLFLAHSALLEKLQLSARRFELDYDEAGKSSELFHLFLRKVCAVTDTIVSGLSRATAEEIFSTTTLVDLIDGRLLKYLYSTEFQPIRIETMRTMKTLVKTLAGVELLHGTSQDGDSHATTTSAAPELHEGAQSLNNSAVMPFSNKVFDRHLESVHIKVDDEWANEKSLASRKIFQEVSHWHNAKRPLATRKAAPTPQDERAAKKAAKREQLFMAEMRTYAASLTNAVGKSLEPETIIVGAPSRPQVTQSPQDSEASDSSVSKQSKGSSGGKKAGGGKTAAKNAGKQAMLNQIAAAKAKKDDSANDKINNAWQVVCKGFEADKDPRSRYRKAKDYRSNLQPGWREIIGAECELYLLNCLLHYWIDACRRKEQERRVQVAALIWSHARGIAQLDKLSKTIIKCLDLTRKTLGLPPLPQPSESPVDRKLAFTFALPSKIEPLSVVLPSTSFQLQECGPYLERSFDSRPDSRVEFQPDGWQRKVLDSIDADQSVFVVAPTSAGKTFISFYAMRKVLEVDDDSILVYVAPTKALVNQIAAEIQARYSKKFKYGGKSVWAIHTRDYRINNPQGCQVLVTVPHVLQILLLAPSHANTWSSRVKRIIFDEIHSIGQAEDGVVWEQLLLMAPCPIVALSATVGNPNEFSDWLATTQEAIGKELVTVQHPYRYSDLRKYFYVPPKSFDFQGVPEKTTFGSLGLEGLPGFRYVHPVAALVDKSRGIPDDLALEPRDCFFLWQAMSKVQTKSYPIAASLDPARALPEVSRKVDVLKWEKDLKVILKSWLQDTASPYDRLVQHLEESFRNEEREKLYSTQPSGDSSSPTNIEDAEDLTRSTLSMLCRLHEQDALPAILFNFDRHQCEKICQTVIETLREAELSQKKTGPKWEKTLERFEEWKKLKTKTSTRAAKASATKSKKGKDDEGDDEKTSKLDLQRDSAGGEDTKWESFDPEAPQEGYHFADHSRAQASELEIYVKQLQYRGIEPYLIEALGRGIGIHHAGMNRKYRQVVEILFRKGFLRVVIATGTLALGINMPCKTVVFSGDSVFLTALNYRQCAGRAGRRGFDLLGNVVFQGVSRQKVCRLISSRLPDLNGHFPITTTLVMRLFTLLHDSNYAKYAVSAINALLSQPRLYMGGQSFKDQTMHHLRFSIEYLRRQQLLGSDGAPLNFAGLVSHLYFTENSAFAFHALLKEGYFHDLCADIDKNEKPTLEKLMLVMAHLFNRVFCRQADAEYRKTVVKPSSSIVFLPPLPKEASKILLDHNQQTLQVYKAYVETFVDQHVHHPDDKLPLSGLKAGAGDNKTQNNVGSLPPTRIRSPFVALSGAGDEFSSIHDLCHTTRDGVFLEEAVIPHMALYPEEMKVPLNAWLLDFYKHGDVHTLERANGIRRSDVWFLLNDFSLVLKVIITSLQNFMKLKDGGDMDMLDVMGNLDAHEEEEDDKVAANEQQTTGVSTPSQADSGIVLPERPSAITKKKAKNANSWEDLADEEEKIDRKQEAEGVDAALVADALAAWEGEGGKGLKDVLKAFQRLGKEFEQKFKAMWA